MDEEDETTLAITEIPLTVSKLYLSLYLKKILDREEVTVDHAEGRDAATAVVKGPRIDIETIRESVTEYPLSDQIIGVSILDEDDEVAERGAPVETPGPRHFQEHSLWSLDWTSSTPVPTMDIDLDAGPVEGRSFSSNTANGASMVAVGPQIDSPTFPDDTLVSPLANQPKVSAKIALSKPPSLTAEQDEEDPTGPTEDTTMSPSESPKTDECQAEAIPIPPEKWKLVASHLMDDDSFKGRMDEASHTIAVKGDEDKVKVYEVLAMMVEVPIRWLSTKLGNILCTTEGEKALQDKKCFGTLVVRDDTVYVVLNSAMEKETLLKLKSVVKHDECPFLEAHDDFVKSKEWETLSIQLATEFLAVAEINMRERKISLSGVSIELALHELESRLRRNATTKQSLPMTSGMKRYMDIHEPQLLQELKSKIKIQMKQTNQFTTELHLSGQVSEVRTAHYKLQKCIDSLAHDKEAINRAGTRAVFTSNSGKHILQGIETSRVCVIEVEDGHDPKPPFVIRSEDDDGFKFGALLRSFGCGSGSGRDDSMPSAKLQKPAAAKKNAAVKPPLIAATNSSFAPQNQPMAAKPQTMSTLFSRLAAHRHFMPPQVVPPESKDGDRLLFSTGGVSFFLFRGDLTAYKAAVLVNTPVAECRTFAEGGAVANSFLRKGGQELEQDYFDQCAESDDKRDSIISTPAYGQLQNLCQHIYHMKLRSWHIRTERNRGTEKKVQYYIKDCLRRCVGDRVSSIAFPTIGCGQFKYPIHKVAGCFKYELKKFAEDGHTLKVTLVAYDGQTYRQVLDYFEPRRHRAHDSSEDEDVGEFDRRDSTEEEDEEENKEEEDEEEEEEEAKAAEEAFSMVDGGAFAGAAPDSTTTTVSACAGLVFHVYAKTTVTIRRALLEIDQHLKDSLSEDTVKLQKAPSRRTLVNLKALNSDKVNVTIDPKTHTINLAGVSNPVIACRKYINLLVDKDERQLLPPNQKKLLGLAMDDVSTVPNHWTKKMRELAGKPGTYDPEVVHDKSLEKAVTKVLQKSWRSDLVGQGSDALSLNHKSLIVKKVERVENPRLWQDYNNKRKQLLLEAAVGSRKFPAIDGLDREPEVQTRSFKVSDLDKLVEKGINEVFLFHGTTNERRKAIVLQGLDSRLGESRGMFGQGVYFAESSTKADQYADPKQARTGGDHYMILARVLLGNTFVCHKPEKMQRPPCTICKKADCRIHGEFFDSVIGIKRNDGNRLLFREFVVYDKGMCYPECVITYERR